MIRLSGPATREALAAVLDPTPRPFDAGCSRALLRVSAGVWLPILLTTYRAPASYTGEDSAEILLPGNPHLAARVLAAFTALDGVRAATPGEFTARAYLNDKLTLDQAEGVAATIAAQNDEQLRAAGELLSGQAGGVYRAWADELATLLALVEAGIDFTDQEDVVPIAPGVLSERLGVVAGDVESRLGSVRGGESAAALPRVVLVGPPNAGKSTLFNTLLGRVRAVVSPVAGTTRDVLEEPLDLSGELPGAGGVLLMDLAGLDAPGEPSHGAVERGAQARAWDAIGAADVLLYCDPSGRFDAAGLPGVPTIRVRTKADLPGAGGGDVAVCALDRWNLPVLRRAIAEHSGASRAAGLAALLPRHRRALAQVRDRLRHAAATVNPGSPRLGDPELTAAAIREALDSLGELVGRISPDDVIGRIFATFCVGK